MSILTKNELFNKICSLIKNSNLTFSSISNDGRVNSIKDEDIIIDYLKTTEINDYILNKDDLSFNFSERKVGDIYLKNPENNEPIVVNIKISSGKSSDNAFSKIGLLVAFTDIPIINLPKSIGWKQLCLMLKNNLSFGDRDYYYLYINKNSCNCLIRGLKKISTFKINRSNILQINWTKEIVSDENKYSDEESFKNVLHLIHKALTQDVSEKNFFIDNFND